MSYNREDIDEFNRRVNNWATHPGSPLSIGQRSIQQKFIELLEAAPNMLVAINTEVTAAELKTWRNEGEYDGVFIIHGPVVGYSDGIYPLTPDEVKAFAHFYYNSMIYTTECAPPQVTDIKRFAKLKFVCGSVVFFKDIPQTKEEEEQAEREAFTKAVRDAIKGEKEAVAN